MANRKWLWVELLNHGVLWQDAVCFGAWLEHVGAGGGLEAKIHAGWMRDLLVLRFVFASRVLGRGLEPDETDRLTAWLGSLTVRCLEPETRFGFALPALRGERPTSKLPPPLETLLSTGLLQLLASQNSLEGSRCAGLLRSPTRVSGFSPSDESAFGERAGLTPFLERGGLVQCPRLVLAPRRARYCSKSCSNATFVLRKGAREPRYFAAKQQSYRIRQERQQDTAHRGALVFLD